MRLRVAQPTVAGGQVLPQVSEFVRNAQRDDTQRFDWARAGEPADVRLHIEDEQLWLLPATGSLRKSGVHKTPSIALAHAPEKFTALLRDSLQRIGKAISLLRVAEQLPDTSASDLQVTVSRLPDGSNRAVKPLSASSIETLPDGAKVGFSISNKSRMPFDITLLYVDSAFGITPLFPGAGEDNRIMPGSVLRAGDAGLAPIAINAETLGVERLLLIATAVQPQSERSDFSYLAQPRLERARGTEGQHSILQELLEQAAFDASPRGAGQSRHAPAFLRVFAWEVTKD